MPTAWLMLKALFHDSNWRDHLSDLIVALVIGAGAVVAALIGSRRRR